MDSGEGIRLVNLGDADRASVSAHLAVAFCCNQRSRKHFANFLNSSELDSSSSTLM